MDRYSKIIEKIWKYQRKKLRDEINSSGIPSWMDEKIKKTIERTFLDKKYESIIKESLSNDDVLLSFFMKDPKRQNIYEKIFKDELTKEGFNVEKLKTSGSKAIYLFNDQIINNQVNKPKELKSLDFAIHHNNKTIYVINKYTNEPGGAQDNQYNDVIIQLKNLGSKTVDLVWFCLDGKYYTQQKVETLKKINKNAHIFNFEELLQKLKTIK